MRGCDDDLSNVISRSASAKQPVSSSTAMDTEVTVPHVLSFILTSSDEGRRSRIRASGMECERGRVNRAEGWRLSPFTIQCWGVVPSGRRSSAEPPRTAPRRRPWHAGSALAADHADAPLRPPQLGPRARTSPSRLSTPRITPRWPGSVRSTSYSPSSGSARRRRSGCTRHPKASAGETPTPLRIPPTGRTSSTCRRWDSKSPFMAYMGEQHPQRHPASLGRYREFFSRPPRIHVNHAKNLDNLYWVSARVSRWRRTLRLRGAPAAGSLGHDDRSDFFWGDPCRGAIARSRAHRGTWARTS